MTWRVLSTALLASQADVCVQVTAGCGTSGVITGSFGKSGKFRVSFADGLPQQLGDGDKALALVFKRFVFDRDKRHMAQ